MDSSGKQKSGTFDKKTAARVWGSDREAEIRNGSYRDPDAGRMRFEEWYERWLAALVVEKSTKPAT